MEYAFQVRWGDTDAAGIVFYPNFYKWMDEASHHFFASLGHSTWKWFQEERIGMPIVEAKCQFHAPLFFEDHVCVKSSIDDLREKSFRIQHQFFRGDQLVADGYEVRVWTTFAGDRPKAAPIPAELRENMRQTAAMTTREEGQ
ncbi:4-hydroxybenzoyl-CoA thioesterase [Geobacillus subterraneus]|uniref:4-hydroxybenzoyl-CoA thioesterase n=2 Tax=Geobacillus TaxID=129337 RepID=A0ABN4NLN4_9BACL|nr:MULTISPECIES: thioesterase family protein [Geobacillus]AMX83825.1 4-hydroxybenzoyl-CoA thioesterase [Geobacillus subterraneus]KZS26881.1 4-hydroxybenzoyl-CoA thioesterase [Geobacillus subterraneus]OXB88035.1 4-hydroxybenzoyl-CoA thioesterase [Geobacillus uzenensis]